ncbi:ABC transporter substrate-binding protein [Ramlibacter sp. H39-3-26]|uniref:ABC transporter substrate-binding protein n=1 Tax=Curvibacter soli TaxID=3031331 RepID=UPI0023DA46A3|nr:ABC transporter substrate-binding protein [Ramlibacter sp. H39-3-26]MDF1485818.1 ABC transporter substrate-binding protein [Ramlibacter sp. H39-3-26]
MKNALKSIAAAALFISATAVFSQEKIVFATNWKAQAAHGGFYQALADGTYKRYGLDVEIRPGGPQVNNRPLLPAGKIDFLMTGNLLHSFDNVKNGVPTIVVAAMFQKDPQAIFAHPGQGYANFKDLTKAPVAFIAKDAQFSFWQWMKAEYGFRDEALRPYVYNLGPFLANPQSIQQGYAVEEPLAVRAQGGFAPQIFLLADQGYSTYSTTIEARTDTVEHKPETVRRFVEASILGWYGYLYGDPKAANALMQQANPDLSDANLDGSRELIKQLGIVDSGEALAKGIGAIDPARIADFYAKMVKAGLYKAGEVDLSKVATTRFVNQGLGLDVKKRLTAGR